MDAYDYVTVIIEKQFIPVGRKKANPNGFIDNVVNLT